MTNQISAKDQSKRRKRKAPQGRPTAKSIGTRKKSKSTGKNRPGQLPFISSIALENFKCFSTLPRLALSPITILTGPNSCGKSSIIQALVLLKQSLEHAGSPAPLIFNEMVHLGSARRVINAASKDGSFRIELGISIPSEDGPRNTLVGLSFEPTNDDRRPTTLTAFELFDSDRKLLFSSAPAPTSRRQRGSDYKAAFHKKGITTAVKAQLGKFDIKWTSAARMKFEGFIPRYAEILVKKEHRARLPLSMLWEPLADAVMALEYSLKNQLFYIGPLRIEPSDLYVQTPRRIGVRGENCMAYLRAHKNDEIVDGMPDDSTGTLLECANAWLAHLGASRHLHFEDVGDSHFEALTDDSRRLTEVGCGVGQLLPVVVQCLSVARSATVLLEQPEIHLHQRLQAGLADLLISGYRRGARFVVETHSEILIQRLRRRIAESPADDLRKAVSVYFGDKQTFTSIHIDGNGEVSEWPEFFFDQGLNELRALSQAVAMREST